MVMKMNLTFKLNKKDIINIVVVLMALLLVVYSQELFIKTPFKLGLKLGESFEIWMSMFMF